MRFIISQLPINHYPEVQLSTRALDLEARTFTDAAEAYVAHPGTVSADRSVVIVVTEWWQDWPPTRTALFRYTPPKMPVGTVTRLNLKELLDD